jgi:hypothetical protein
MQLGPTDLNVDFSPRIYAAAFEESIASLLVEGPMAA